MKKVFSKPEDVAHLWANIHQDEARTPTGNFSFHGRLIYSYSTVMARIMEDGTVLFNTRTYSNTTSKHQGVISMACRHLNRINVNYPPTGEHFAEWEHEKNLKDWQQEIEHYLAKLKRARKPEMHISSINGIMVDVNKYCAYFNIPLSPELTYLTTNLTYENFAGFDKEREEKQRVWEIQKRRQGLKVSAEKIKEWISGETTRLYGGSKYDFLRVNTKGRVETTQAVEIPYAIAKVFHKLVKTNKLKVGDSILNFKVDEIGTVIKIGCHRFRRTYLVKFGNNLKKPKKIIE